MTKRIELSPILKKFADAVASDGNAQGAAQELTDILKKAGASEIKQVSVKRIPYGLEIYMATDKGREVTARVATADEKYKVVSNALDEFVKKYNYKVFGF